MTEQALLQLNDTQIADFLAHLSQEKIEHYQYALALLWQVHPDADLQKQAQQLLQQQFTPNLMEKMATTLSIFDSIVNNLPWAGDYRPLQQQNHAIFEANKTPYEELLATSSVLVEQYLDLGRRLYKFFDLLPEAKACFEGILSYNPQQAEALYALGRVVEQEGAYEQAIAYYEQCIAADAQHIYAHLQLGILLVKQEQNYEKAIGHYQVVLDVEPYMGETHVHMATAHRAMGDISRAKQFVEIALDINPYQEEALNLLGWIQWRDEENVDAALATFEKGVDHQIHGDSGLLLASLGRLHQEQLGDYNKARLYYEKSLAANLQQQETFQHLMSLLEEHYQDYGAMAQYYQQYLEKPQLEPSIHTNYAAFSAKYLHDFATAQQQLEKALELEEDYPPAVALSLQINQQLDIHQEEADNYVYEEGDDDDDDFSGGGAAGDN